MPAILRQAAVAASLSLIGVMASAQTTTTNDTQTTESTYSSPAVATTPAEKLVTRFSTFTGSDENAASLVNGLRTGSEITLTDSGAAGSTGGSTTFVSPTRPMGYGNIRIALSLAEARLNSEGYPQPTAEQLQTALLGDTSGTATQSSSQTQGILQMRADGMGWGQIANSMGFKLGAVMSGRALNNSAATTAAGAAGGGSDITTAGGHPMGKHDSYSSRAGQGKGNGASASGIVTASGAAGGGGAGRNSRAFTAAGNANGHAVTAGSSGSASSSGAVSAHGAGNGRGNAYGHTK